MDQKRDDRTPPTNKGVCRHNKDSVKKCTEYRVKGRRLVGKPRKTWLESVEADMAELEIDKGDVHDRSKLRRNVNVMKSNPIRKWTINRYYNIYISALNEELYEIKYHLKILSIVILAIFPTTHSSHTLDDLLEFNDTAQACTEQWKKIV